ncbi:hypothetical protein ACFQMF_15395 [Halorubrum rutilum]|uniref:Heme exporter protein D n=1 Tax=Halorubrum rutilum TaxID=1364933 RepID=A0ABD6AQB1_9EURY|nr:hypothetical protein [Halorubrum rutilum]
MTVIGSAGFTLLLWGAVLAVSVVFLYEVYAIADEFGWISGKVGRTEKGKPGGES